MRTPTSGEKSNYQVHEELPKIGGRHSNLAGDRRPFDPQPGTTQAPKTIQHSALKPNHPGSRSSNGVRSRLHAAARNRATRQEKRR
jgi:hypothetical protein